MAEDKCREIPYDTPYRVKPITNKDGSVKNGEDTVFWTEPLKGRVTIATDKPNVMKHINFNNQQFLTNDDTLKEDLRKFDGYNRVYWEGELPEEIRQVCAFRNKDKHSHAWMLDNEPETHEKVEKEESRLNALVK